MDNSKEQRNTIYRKTLWIVTIAQIFGGAGLAAGVTVGALLAREMLGTDGYAGIPVALITLGSAAAAFLIGRITQRRGRRFGLTAGFLAGGIGALGVVWAGATNELALLFASLLVYGAGTSTNLQARYAGTDLARPEQRARSISISMVSTTLGAVAGPNLVEPMGRFAASFGLPALTGPFLLAGTAFLLAGLVLLVFLRPDPFLLAKAIAAEERAETRPVEESSAHRGARPPVNRGLIVGATVMVLTQVVMVAIMTMTPIHMQHHGHGLNAVGLVIGIHVAAMYLPSLVTGILVDRFGRNAMAYAAGVTLLLAGLLAAWAPGSSMPWLVVALALLGLGWNFGLISGTAQVVDATTIHTRAKMQGNLDVLIALTGAGGGALSGVVVAHSSYGALSLIGGALALLLLPVVLWARRDTRQREETGIRM
ncbi:MFS transporter [Paenibacillaceae bacterium WGS1546]|uniref:MFS transporter n=1 Tax=Cohnella sp. WGS1546 TaxID=3366810 RepID=UPI00372D7016